MTEPKGKFRYMLIDGNALVHRGYHAMPNLSNKKGEPTGGVYGFSLIFLKAIADIKPTHIACTFDMAAPTFRHAQFEGYKATRVKAPQELYDQIPKVKEVVRALNVPIFEMAGYEADDVLGTLACEIEKESGKACEILIVTGDLDTLQLIDDSTRVYTLKKGLTDTYIYDAESVKERYGGLEVSQLVDFRALKGDPSDNISGVKGIGEKTAIGIVKEFRDINNLYNELHNKVKEFDSQFPKNFQYRNLKSRILNLLLEHEKEARLSYELSKIKCDVPIEFKLPRYNFGPENFETTFKLFQDLEFKSLVARLPKNYGQTVEPEKFETAGGQLPAVLAQNAPRVGKNIGSQKYVLIKTLEELEEAVTKLARQKELAVDTETNSLNPIEAKLVGIALCCADGQAFYVPADLAQKSSALKNLLANPNILKIGHNIKYDLEVLEANGYNLDPISFDTMIASYLLNPGTRQHNLSAVAFAELGYHMQPIEELIGKGKNQITMDQVEPEKVAWYSGEDVDITYRLKKYFLPQLRVNKLDKIFNEIEMPLVPILAQMEQAGIKLDTKLLGCLAGEAEVDIKSLEKQVQKLAGREFNLNSPKQLKEVLFDELGLEPIDNRKTKTGISTAAGNLEKMLGQHPIIEKIMEYRELAKLYSTYLTALPELVFKKTGRLHTSFNQTVTATGRLSSSDPNLQNIPVRGNGVGSKIRQAFAAEKNYALLSLDYSQIELRIIAHLAQDPTMMEVFKAGKDIHTQTAMEIFNVGQDAVTPDMRRDAKTINFGILYGLSSFGLSSRIGEVNRGEAKIFIEKYFAAYPKVREYMDQIKEEVNKKGYITNQLGRVRRFPEIRAGNWQVRAAAERAAINFPIQSLAADVIKVAMIDIEKEIRNSIPPRRDEIRNLLQVHDELVFEVKEDKVEEWAKKLVPLMENAIKLSVPVKVEGKAGKNWGEMKRIDQDLKD